MPADASPTCAVTLEPLGRRLTIARGASLRDALFEYGVEFPCGGQGKCRGCRVKVLAGTLPVTTDDRRLLSQAQLTEGWRLACRAVTASDVVLELAQWEAPILSDQTRFEFVPRQGTGVAIDLGTTTIVAQLVDLATGGVLGVCSELNRQAQHGGDVMSRIEFAQRGCAAQLMNVVREQLGALVQRLCAKSHPAAAPDRAVIVGNTVMHHLFCGCSVAPLASYPFDPAEPGLFEFRAETLGWSVTPMTVQFLPCLGGFVGSDLLAGVLATRLHERQGLWVLVDLGTNGEMVVANDGKLLCASTAAGPAFEGARISCGMRAATGAISEVTAEEAGYTCRVIGGGEARGICGSGLVDAVAVGLDLNAVQPNGRLANGAALELTPAISLVQADVRELQLAKGAIAAGLRLLLRRCGAAPEEVDGVYLAGAFGNYINRASAARIGLIDFPAGKVHPAGNTALLGAKLALFQDDAHYVELRRRIEHVPLADEPEFQDVFVDQMRFPGRGEAA